MHISFYLLTPTSGKVDKSSLTRPCTANEWHSQLSSTDGEHNKHELELISSRASACACSLISAVGIFCLGAGVSIVHGIHAIASPAAHGDNMWGLVALIFSTIVEGVQFPEALNSPCFHFVRYAYAGLVCMYFCWHVPIHLCPGQTCRHTEPQLSSSWQLHSAVSRAAMCATA
jgi:hypothetical protein